MSREFRGYCSTEFTYTVYTYKYLGASDAGDTDEDSIQTYAIFRPISGIAITRFHGLKHPAELGQADVEAFLNHLAVNKSCSINT